MSKVIIRPLERDGRDSWHELWLGYLEFYEQVLDETVTSSLFERLLSDEGHDCFVAVTPDGTLAGFVHFVFQATTWSTRASCYLEDLFVSSDQRGTGAGRKLIEAVYGAADAEPCASGRVYWITDDDNDRARQLYDRIGALSPYVRYDRPQ
ncbi:GNAT family N-acetyltransferase [Rhodobacterales bacterium]|nr:GNAT family N-acetyltransferase [Rhodobacterales bacterium]